MTDRVVVAVNGEAANDAAERWVAWRFRRSPAEIDVTSVLESAPLSPGYADVERDHRMRRLDDVADRLRSELRSAKVRTELRHGNLIDELIAVSSPATMLVVGMTRVDTVDEIGHLPLGLKLAGRTTGTLVVVPTAWTGDGSGVVVGWAVDAAGEAAIEFAAREARHTSAVLTIVHAGGDEIPRDLDLAVQRMRTAHRELEVRVITAASGPAPALLDVARGASLIVVGSHGRGPLEDLFVGSVSEHVLARATQPVAVVPVPREPIAVSPDVVDEEL